MYRESYVGASVREGAPRDSNKAMISCMKIRDDGAVDGGTTQKIRNHRLSYHLPVDCSGSA